MLKYVDTLVTFSEVPDEITLCINISNCPCHCEGCHSSYLAEDIGNALDNKAITTLIGVNKGISCVCIMGGDSDVDSVNKLAEYIKFKWKNLKVAWYSGRQELNKDINLNNLDFIKLGPYIKELGPLNSKTTNQRFYKVNRDKLIDITNKFYKHEIKN